MKKIFRMIVFSGVALYLTSLWNKGFILNLDWKNLLISTLAIAVLYYLINPVAKMILLPINVLSFGLISMIVYFLLFHFVITHYALIAIKSWTLNSYPISYYLNVALSAFSVSTIISFLEGIL